MINKHFPTAYDVEQTVNFRETSYKSIKRFMQSKGVFYIGNSKGGIAKLVSNILFEHEDYLYMRRLAQGAISSASISGFTLKSNSVPLAIETLKNDILAKREQFKNQEQDRDREGAPTREVSMPVFSDADSMTLKFKYQRLIPGRIELMERVDTNIQLIIRRINPLQWQVTCFPEANQDIQVVRKLLFDKPNSGLYEPFLISLENFTQKQRIQFFDDVLDYYRSHQEWLLLQVIGLTIKRDRKDDQHFNFEDKSLNDEQFNGDVFNSEPSSFLEEDEASNEDALQTTRDALQSISQAVLEGTHLRENKFVRECEAHGFYFPSITLRLENKKLQKLLRL